MPKRRAVVIEEIREHVGSVGRRRLLPNSRALPGNLDRYIGDIPRHDYRAARGEGRHRRNGVRGERIIVSRPTVEGIMGHPKDGRRAHVPCNDEGRVVRHVVAMEDLVEVLWRHREHSRLVTDRVLAHEPISPQPLVDGPGEREARLRGAALELAEHDEALAKELVFDEAWPPYEIRERLDRASNVRRRQDQIVGHGLVGRGAVEGGVQLSGDTAKALILRAPVSSEEHVLVEVRHALIFWLLNHRASAHNHLDGGERHGMVLDDDHLEAVRQRLVMRDALEGGALRYSGRREESGGGEHDECGARHCALASRTEYRHKLKRQVGFPVRTAPGS